METSSNKTKYNVAGGVLGILLAALSIFGLVHSQSDAGQPQKYSSKISYDG